jgi:ABC-type multidrug transport system fused ATPase/permease subunit
MKCPNCHEDVPKGAQRCPNCGFELPVKREDYHQTSNSTVSNMIAWIKANATLVFWIGIGLMILTSFSWQLGWFCLLALLIWLFIICEKKADVSQYVADQRLEADVDRVGSKLVNHVEQRETHLKEKRQQREEAKGETRPVRVKRKRTSWQIGILLMALISLLVIFFGPFASYSMMGFSSGPSIARSLLSIGALGGRHILTGYGLLLLLILVPALIILLTLKDREKFRVLIFAISLIETVLLLYVAIRLVFLDAGASFGVVNNQQLAQSKASQVLYNAISFGVSSYLLLLSSIITTVLTFKNWQQFKKQK